MERSSRGARCTSSGPCGSYPDPFPERYWFNVHRRGRCPSPYQRSEVSNYSRGFSCPERGDGKVRRPASKTCETLPASGGRLVPPASPSRLAQPGGGERRRERVRLTPYRPRRRKRRVQVDGGWRGNPKRHHLLRQAVGSDRSVSTGEYRVFGDSTSPRSQLRRSHPVHQETRQRQRFQS